MPSELVTRIPSTSALRIRSLRAPVSSLGLTVVGHSTSPLQPGRPVGGFELLGVDRAHHDPAVVERHHQEVVTGNVGPALQV